MERSYISAAKTTRTKHMFSDTYELVSAVLWKRRYDLATEKLKQNTCTGSLSMSMTYAAHISVFSDFSFASAFSVWALFED